METSKGTYTAQSPAHSRFSPGPKLLFQRVSFSLCVSVCLVSKRWKAVTSSWAQRWRTVHRAWTSSAQWPWPSHTAPRWTPRTGTSSSREKPRTANGRWELQDHTCQVQYSPSRSWLCSDTAFGSPRLSFSSMALFVCCSEMSPGIKWGQTHQTPVLTLFMFTVQRLLHPKTRLEMTLKCRCIDFVDKVNTRKEQSQHKNVKKLYVLLRSCCDVTI